MIGCQYPQRSNYHRRTAANDNLNTWHSWLYQRQIGRQTPLGFRDRQQKDTYSLIRPVASWDTCNHGAIFNLEFSPDGRILVAACEGKSFLVFDPLNGKLVNHVSRAHNDCVNCIRFLDARVFATCSDDMTVALWDIRYPKNRISSLRGHSNWVKNIEYATSSRLLVSSGFDGSVFVWDINRYTEDIQFKQVCHISGLMRTKLTPDESKLVMCTTAGYMMIINDLDLNNLASDLEAFNPNAYRRMQITGKADRHECHFNRLFKAKRNRVEFVSDFPGGNAAEIISSLQVHPHSWCILSRNTSFDKQSEWTCIHDLQDRDPSSDSDNEDDDPPLSSPENTYGPEESERINEESTRRRGRPVLRFHFNYCPRRQPSQSQEGNQEENDFFDRLGLQVQFTNSEVLALVEPRQTTIEVSGRQLVNALANAQESLAESNARGEGDGHRDLNGDSRPNLDQRSIFFNAMSQLVVQSTTESIRAASSAASTSSVPDGLDPGKSFSRLRIHENKPRLTHFCDERNVGQGFIKELCFSTDGRLVCSPYAFGIRLFAFDSECRELCDSVPSSPRRLHELVTKVAHSNVVVSTKHSPTHPLIVSGCLDGKVCFHQPVLP